MDFLICHYRISDGQSAGSKRLGPGLSPAPFNRVALMTKRLRMLTTDAIGPKP